MTSSTPIDDAQQHGPNNPDENANMGIQSQVRNSNEKRANQQRTNNHYRKKQKQGTIQTTIEGEVAGFDSLKPCKTCKEKAVRREWKKAHHQRCP